jgi:GT2 family glycosyltransferase
MDDLISVIVLNWNGKTVVRACLDSVLSQNYEKIEIIVVDNASEDGSAEIVENDYKQVLLIRNHKNLGFGAGNNIGIREAKGDYILVLNNDTELDRACIGEMKRAIDQDRRYGACASKIYFRDTPGIIDAAGIVVYPDGLSIGRGQFEPGNLYEREEEVFFASGCCALYRREMLEDIKLAGEYYDEDFFAYAEDTDLGWRARLRGWRCIYTPAAVVYHAHSAATGNYSPFKAYLVERNRMWLETKNFPLILIAYGCLFTLARYLFQAYGAFGGKGAAGEFSKEYSKARLATILLRAYVSALRGCSRMLPKRRIIQRGRVLGVSEIHDICRRFGIRTKSIALKDRWVDST